MDSSNNNKKIQPKEMNRNLDKFNQIGFQVTDSIFKSIVKRRPLKVIPMVGKMNCKDDKINDKNIENEGPIFRDKRDRRVSQIFTFQNLQFIDESEIPFKLF